MPILEFALDATSPYRVQVHLNTHQGPVSVMLNRSVLGSLITIEEQHAGKEFRLPDSSLLRVSINDGQAQAWRNGQPLQLTSIPTGPLALEHEERHWSSGVMALLVLNILAASVLMIWFALQAYFVTPSSRLFLPLLEAVLVSLFGLIGLFVFLAWKKWGLYLVVCYVVVNMALTILFGMIDYRTFIPLVALILLYASLRSSGLWHSMG